MKVLKLLNLSDHYERKARLLPALLAASPLLPGVGALSSTLVGVLSSVAIGSGLGAVLAIGLSHVASASGHRFETRLCRRWGALHTELWLRPEDTTCSRQQKDQWYAAIKKLTGLDIARAMGEGAEAAEIHRLIRDACKQLRHRFRSSTKSGLLVKHNEDYGFARNLGGLAWVWLPASVLSTAVSWIAWRDEQASVGWPIASTIVQVLAIIFLIGLPEYVRARSIRYTESFFGTLCADAGVERMRAPRLRAAEAQA